MVSSVRRLSCAGLARELGLPDFMKIDTEGHEAAVLDGAQEILAEGRTDLLIECVRRFEERAAGWL